MKILPGKLDLSSVAYFGKGDVSLDATNDIERVMSIRHLSFPLLVLQLTIDAQDFLSRVAISASADSNMILLQASSRDNHNEVYRKLTQSFPELKTSAEFLTCVLFLRLHRFI